MPGADRLVPTYLIKLNNKRLPPEMSVDLQAIAIEEHLNCPAMFLLTFSRQKQCWCAHKDLSLGSSVVIELGYLNGTKVVMDGEITGDGAEYSSFEPAYTTVKGYDRLHRLARRHMTRTFRDMKDWQIAYQIAEEAHLAADIQDKAGEPHTYVVQNGLQDLAFLLERAKRAGREIGVNGKNLFWRKPAEDLEPVAVLEWGKSLREFSVNVTGMGEKSEVIVRGIDPKTQQAIVWREESRADMPFGRAREVVIDNSVKSVAEAENLAKAVLREKQMEYMTAQGSCLGNPDIHVGQTLMIKGVADKVDGKYYIVTVEHELNGGEGYITRFKLKKPKPPSDKKKSKSATGEDLASTAAASSAAASAGSREGQQPSLTNAQWSQSEVKRGDKIKLTAQTQNIPDNTEIAFVVSFKAKDNQTPTVLRLPAKVKNNKLEADWKFTQRPEGDKTPADRYPTYFFEVEYQDQKAKSEKLEFKEPINIFVLVPGTTDPENIDENSRSKSRNSTSLMDSWGMRMTKEDGTPYPRSDSSYWSGSSGMLDKLNELKEEYYDLKIFRGFSWSGDNSKAAREKAGQELAQCLLDAYADKQAKDKSQDYGNRDISFHLIGHSHGGNVINEFTQTIAKSAWPAVWKIKSVTYLSTPFFRNHHHPDTGKFHGDYKIISIYNQYDLTQRVLADFSLHDLNGILTEIKQQGIDRQAEDIIQIYLHKALKELEKEIDRTAWKEFGKNLLPGGIIQVAQDMLEGMPLYNGRELYEAGINLFMESKEMLKLIDHLKENLGKINPGTNHTIITAQLKKRIDKQLLYLSEAVEKTIFAFTARMRKNSYTFAGLIDDLKIKDLLSVILSIIEIDPENLTGVLLDIIYDLIREQIDIFDDTFNSPKQFISKDKLIEIDITKYDPYYKQKDYAYNRFIQKMEKWEVDYASSQKPKDLMNLAITLLVQSDFASSQLPLILDKMMKTAKNINGKIMTWIFPKIIEFKTQIKEFYEILWNWWTIIDQRKHNIIVENDVTTPKRGELEYLLIKSHNLSMQGFYEKKDNEEYEKYFKHIKKQIDTPKKKDIEE